MRSGAISTPTHRHNQFRRWLKAKYARQNIEAETYLTALDPKDYACADCGVTGVKLWREVGFFGHVRSWCAPCAGHDNDVDEFGRSPSYYTNSDGETRSMGDSDQLYPSKYGNLLPSVPCDGGWWGYTSVPDFGCKWWKELPTYKTQETAT